MWLAVRIGEATPPRTLVLALIGDLSAVAPGLMLGALMAGTPSILSGSTLLASSRAGEVAAVLGDECGDICALSDAAVAMGLCAVSKWRVC